ncbi:MAG: putative ABC exporter domain-containing protein, partial [Gemmatimonadota bacterium]|nr:putative ABC exporter domain-containing protein [Gemmatimonadota bacterium]
MTGIFWYLASRSISNRIRRQLSRLRQPRYALVMAFGLLYFWSVFWRPGGANRSMIASSQSAPTLSLIMAVGLALLVISWWLIGTDRHALAFTPAEVQFLFPAPLSRRSLIQYKLLRAQSQVLLSTVVWVVLLGRGGERGLAALPRALGLWTLLSTISLHRIGASLVRSSAAEHGRSGLRRSALPLVLAGAAALALAGSVVAAIPALRRDAAAG